LSSDDYPEEGGKIPWHRRILGDEGYVGVAGPRNQSPEDLAIIRSVFPEAF
jgi:hypothetical protein